YVLKTSEPDPRHLDHEGTRSAILRWRQPLQGLWQGDDIYQQYNYPNAPIMGLILSPLAYLPRIHALGCDVDLSGLCWFLFKVGMTVLTFFLAVRLIEDPGRPFPMAGQFLMLLLSLRPIVGDLSHGNVNLLILFLVVASLYAYRQGRDAWSGLIL